MISRTHIKYVKQYSADAVDDINLKFAQAKEEIESAMESKETVYFNEEAECARRAVGMMMFILLTCYLFPVDLSHHSLPNQSPLSGSSLHLAEIHQQRRSFLFSVTVA
ncbi:hypothetical protein F511_09636 [Dorcoceras hygrometricum]|uniref:Uncharacterized protein n=1 Tax=Dorcoceras hygrometricum TaxID=472368 RepID=A0A2Z7DA88_9LAMI|nr:hypothetical protein F511_09636 [Dorcoceras hygrometricum]